MDGISSRSRVGKFSLMVFVRVKLIVWGSFNSIVEPRFARLAPGSVSSPRAGRFMALRVDRMHVEPMKTNLVAHTVVLLFWDCRVAQVAITCHHSDDLETRRPC